MSELKSRIQKDTVLVQRILNFIQQDPLYILTFVENVDYHQLGTELLQDCTNPASKFYKDNGFDDIDDGESGSFNNQINSFTEHFYRVKEIANYFLTLKILTK